MSLSGKTIVFTGALEMKRAEAKAKAEVAGASVVGAISKKTDIVIAGPGAGGKLTSAKGMGVDVWTEAQFIAALSAKGGKKKRASGDDAAPAAKKAKAAPKPSPVKKTGLAGSSTAVLKGATGTLDAGVARTAPKLAPNAVLLSGKAHKTLRATLDAKLVLIEPKINSDKYYVLQAFCDAGNEAKSYVFSRWGRTGTAGGCKLEGPMKDDKAKTGFDKLFYSKTGQKWDERVAGRQLAGKYEFLAQDDKKAAKTKKGAWEYFVSDGVDGKKTGWYPYDEEASQNVEDLYMAFHVHGNKSMHTRFVLSGSYTYKVDLKANTQTNTSTSKERQIRRKL